MAVRSTGAATNFYGNYDKHDYNTKFGAHNSDNYYNFTQTCRFGGLMFDRRRPDLEPSLKRSKTASFSCESTGINYQGTYQNNLVNRAGPCKPSNYDNACGDAQLVGKNSASVAETRSGGANACALSMLRRDRLTFEDEKVVFMSRDDIEKCSPSRKDGID